MTKARAGKTWPPSREGHTYGAPPYRIPRRALTGVLVALLVAGLSRPTGGALVVYDPTNWVENAATAAQTAEMVVNTAEMIEHQIEMIANQVEIITHQITNLEPLGISVIPELLGIVDNILSVLHSVDGLPYEAVHIQERFNDLYPQFGLPAVTGETFVGQMRQWNLQARRALEQAMQAQSVVEAIATDADILRAAVARSEAAIGNLQVEQAGNQIDGVVATQLFRLQGIMAAVHREQASARAMEAAINDASMANAQYMMQGLGSRTEVAPNAMPDLSF